MNEKTVNRFATRWVWFACLLTIVSTMLGGCGFQLRGQADFTFKNLQVVAGDSTALIQELKRVLRTNGVTVVNDIAQSDAQLTILSEGVQRSILTFNSSGSAREIELRYVLSFQLRDAKGNLLIAPSQILLKRDLTYSDNQVLAKTSEEQILTADMRSDVVQQLMRRLAAARPGKTIGLDKGPV